MHCVYPCLCIWNPLIDKYRGNGVNRCTKGSLTGVTEVAEIAVLRVVSSSQVGVDPFGIGCWVRYVIVTVVGWS